MSSRGKGTKRRGRGGINAGSSTKKTKAAADAAAASSPVYAIRCSRQSTIIDYDSDNMDDMYEEYHRYSHEGPPPKVEFLAQAQEQDGTWFYNTAIAAKDHEASSSYRAINRTTVVTGSLVMFRTKEAANARAAAVYAEQLANVPSSFGSQVHYSDDDDAATGPPTVKQVTPGGLAKWQHEQQYSLDVKQQEVEPIVSTTLTVEVIEVECED